VLYGIGKVFKIEKSQNYFYAFALSQVGEFGFVLLSYGFTVYYGDATRIPVLRAAGIQEAKILALCLDNPEDNKYIAELVRTQFPNVRIYVRAQNRQDAYYYINHGIQNIYRETLGTAVEMAIDLLHETGMRKYAARRLGRRFMLIDKASVKKLAKRTEEDTSFFSIKEAIQQEEALLAYDSLNFENHDWMENEDIEDDTPPPTSINES